MAFFCKWNNGDIIFAEKLPASATQINKVSDDGDGKIRVKIDHILMPKMNGEATLYDHNGVSQYNTATCYAVKGDGK